MEVGAVPEVLEHVLDIGKGRLAYPGHTLASHLGKGMGFPVGHPGRHIVAANSAKGVAAFGNFGRGIVWATRTEVRHSFNTVPGSGQRDLFFLNPLHPLFHGLGLVKTPDAAGDSQCDHGRREFRQIRQ